MSRLKIRLRSLEREHGASLRLTNPVAFYDPHAGTSELDAFDVFQREAAQGVPDDGPRIVCWPRQEGLKRPHAAANS